MPTTYILDVYIDIAPRHKAWVQDITPLTASFMNDSNFFTLEEVISSSDAEFRTLSQDSVVRPMKGEI